MKKLIPFLLILLLIGCSEHRVDTFHEWCEQIRGVDLEKKYAPFWAMFFFVSFDREAIRDEFTNFLNKTHLEKVENRAQRMAWREDMELHIVNLSSLLAIEPEKVIEEWKHEIELAKQYKHTDTAKICVYGTLTSMFNNLHIHSMEPDALKAKWIDNVTVISTDRKERLSDKRP
jgi:hypothetical protein